MRETETLSAEASRGERVGSHRAGKQRASAGKPVWEPPAFRVVALDCEITAYAPDDEPLF